jgi:hypothetical protein
LAMASPRFQTIRLTQIERGSLVGIRLPLWSDEFRPPTLATERRNSPRLAQRIKPPAGQNRVYRVPISAVALAER